jgi:hypothetical protein
MTRPGLGAEERAIPEGSQSGCETKFADASGQKNGEKGKLISAS